MAEEATNTEQTPTEAGQVTQPEQSVAKTFTQEEVDGIVEARLAREKTKWETKESDYKSQVSDLQTKLTVGEKTGQALKETYESLKTELDPGKLSLIPEGLTTHEKINYVIKNKQFLTKQTEATSTPTVETKVAPATLPTTDKKESAELGTELYGGKYTNILDWAKNDPVEYKKWAKQNPYKLKN